MIDRTQFLALAATLAGKLYDEATADTRGEPTPPAPPTPPGQIPPVPPSPGPGYEYAEGRGWVYTGRGVYSPEQEFLDAGGAPGQYRPFADFVANQHLSGSPIAIKMAKWKERLAQSTADRDAADKPIPDQGEGWKTRRYGVDPNAYPADDRASMQGLLARWRPCIDAFNALQDEADAGKADRMVPFIVLQALCPNALVYFIPENLAQSKMIREAFTSLSAGGSKMYRDALHVDNSKYTGDVSILPPAKEGDASWAWLRHVGPGPRYTGDAFALPLGTVDLSQHGG